MFIYGEEAVKQQAEIDIFILNDLVPFLFFV